MSPNHKYFDDEVMTSSITIARMCKIQHRPVMDIVTKYKEAIELLGPYELKKSPACMQCVAPKGRRSVFIELNFLQCIYVLGRIRSPHVPAALGMVLEAEAEAESEPYDYC